MMKLNVGLLYSKFIEIISHSLYNLMLVAIAIATIALWQHLKHHSSNPYPTNLSVPHLMKETPSISFTSLPPIHLNMELI